MSILCGVISAILVVILVIAITMKIRFGLFSFGNRTFIPVIIIIEISIINILLDTSCHFYFDGDNAKTFDMINQIIKIMIMIMIMIMMMMMMMIIVTRCGRRTEQTWRKDSSSESSFEISSKSPDLLVKDIQGDDDDVTMVITMLMMI